MAKFFTLSREEKERKPATLGQSIAALVFITLFGLFFLWFGALPEISEAIEAKTADLVEVPARLREIELKERQGSGSGRYGTPTEYWIRVWYTYTYEGVEYHGSRVGYGRDKWRFTVLEWAKDVQNEIFDRKPFFVYVDTRSPDRSVVMNDTSFILGFSAYGSLAMGLLCLWFSGWGAWKLLQLRRSGGCADTPDGVESESED